MANKKQYVIEINGIKESIDAVKSLNQQLDALEQRIKNLEGKVVKVGASSSGGGGGGNVNALSEEEKLEKEILATEERIAKVRSESYQKLLAAKEELKEATTYAKAQYAATENGQGLYDTNTMQGMKAQLKSIKAEMQTVDVNDDKFKQLTQQANELNNKLKEVEASYGQFGRNVGNYANGVAEGMQKVVIKVGDTERTFTSAKQAARELGNELKNMAVNGQRGTKEYNALDEAVRKLNSDLKDVSVSSQGMDNLLDNMQSLVAVSQSFQGFSQLFGFDSSAIDEGIQKLMALQNIAQSLEKLAAQAKAGEGLFGNVGKDLDDVKEATNQVDVNMVDLDKDIDKAGKGFKKFGSIAKSVGKSLLKIGWWTLIIEGISKITEAFNDYKEKEKEFAEWQERIKKDNQEAARTYQAAKTELGMYVNMIDNFNGSAKEEQVIVNELNSKYGASLGYYKTLADWKNVLINKTEDYCLALEYEAKMAAAVKRLEEAYMKEMEAENYEPSLWEELIEGEAAAKIRVKAIAKQNREREEENVANFNKEYIAHKAKLLKDAKETTKTVGKTMATTTRQVESELVKLRIEAMRDGLNKTIAQLEEEKKQRINKIRANGKDVAESVALVEKIYADKILEARKEFAKRMEEQSNEIFESIARIDTETQQAKIEKELLESENELDKQLKEHQERLKKIYSDYAPSLAGISTEALANAGNISAAVKQGQIFKEKGKPYTEEELEGLKDMLDILEDIDYLRGKIYLKERQAQNQYASEIEQLTKKIDEQKEKLEKVKKDIADNTFSDDEFKNRFDKLYGEYIKYIREQKEALNQEAIAEENAMYERLRKMEQDNWDKEHQATTKRLQNELNALRGQKDAEIEATTEAYKRGEINLKEHYERNLAIQQKYAELAASKEEAIVDEQSRIAEKYQQNLDNLLTAHNTKLKEIAGNTSDRIEAVLADDLKSQIAEKLKELHDYQAEIEDAIEKNTKELSRYQELAKSQVGIQFGGESVEELKKLLEEKEKLRDKRLADNGITEEQLKNDVIFDLLQEENYTRMLNNQFIARLGNHIKYYDEVEKENRKHWAKVLETDKANLKIEYQQQVDSASKELEALKEKLDEQEKLEIGAVDENSDTAQQKIAGIRQKYLDQYLQAQEKTGELINQLWDKYLEELKAKQLDYQRNIQTEVAQTQNNIISEYRDFYSKLSALQQEQPIQDAWGIVNMHHTRNNYKSIIDGFTQLSEAIIQQRRELQQKLANNEITFDDFTQARRELNDLQTSVAQSLGDIENKSKNLTGDFIASINTYISAFGNAIQTVMQSLWDLEDYNFQKELAQIDDQNDVLDKKLSEQDDIVKKHADAVNDIEDELATARGDRRQHLIDQLNAEMMAQRAALAEQKNIEKQKEALEKRQKAIERKQKEAEYHRNLMSIAVSNAMAIANALATQPFVPTGIAMGSLAAALGAAQYTIAKKQKPYEHGGQLDGGVAVGKRHRDGGIPVLGGRAAIEGGEFITNRVTTAKNADLLSYINSKKKKVDVTDLLEFFKSEKTRKNITGVRTKFANGGIIPTVTTEFGNSLSNTIVVRDDSVYQVSVVDINNAQDNVKNVQVLAGL